MEEEEKGSIRAFSQWEIEDMIDAHSTGEYSIKEIADRYGVHTTRIMRILNAYKSQPYPMTEHITGENQ